MDRARLSFKEPEILTGIDDLGFVYLSSRDVVRHRIVQDIVEAYRRYDEARS